MINYYCQWNLCGNTWKVENIQTTVGRIYSEADDKIVPGESCCRESNSKMLLSMWKVTLNIVNKISVFVYLRKLILKVKWHFSKPSDILRFSIQKTLLATGLASLKTLMLLIIFRLHLFLTIIFFKGLNKKNAILNFLLH